MSGSFFGRLPLISKSVLGICNVSLDNNLKRAKVVRKAAKVRRKSATSMYKKQRRLAKKIDKYRVPAEMKELAYGLLNKKTQAVAIADECYYKLKRLRPEGRAKRELVREIRRSKRAVRNLDREIRYMLRKLRRIEDNPVVKPF